MKVLISERDFFRLTGSLDILLTWRGVAFVWTDAAWRDGVAQLTLQKVSQPAIEEPPLPYDAEVEYLESTGTQYINLGDMAQVGDVFFFDFQKTALGSNRVIFGGATAVGLGRFNLWQSSTSTTANYYNPGITPDLLRHSVRFELVNTNGQNMQYDGASYTIGKCSTIDANTTIFAMANYAKHIGRFYNFSQSRGGVLIHDLIPVRVGTVGYMYDRVSGQLLGNSGTGDFIVGPDLP